MNLYRSLGKPLLDRLLAAIGLIVLSPIVGGVATLVRVRLGSPVLFWQERPGLNGRPFYMVKFRTMTNERDAAGELLPNHLRITSLGRFLRSTSLDELPELWNVVRGDMSLVGPRPLLMRYLDRYTPAQARRHEVKPGITGLAQVNGRNAISWEEKFEMDIHYVDNHTFAMDMGVLLQTVWKVVNRTGVNQSEQTTMTEFMGSSARENLQPDA